MLLCLASIWRYVHVFNLHPHSLNASRGNQNYFNQFIFFFSENAQYLTEGKTVEAIILYTFLQKSSVFFI